MSMTDTSGFSLELSRTINNSSKNWASNTENSIPDFKSKYLTPGKKRYETVSSMLSNSNYDTDQMQFGIENIDKYLENLPN